MTEYKASDAQAVKDYFADRLSTMLAEADRCGVSNTTAIQHKSAMSLEWALSNHLTVAQVKFSELQYWIQAEELETTADQEVLTFAVEYLPNQIHQQAIAKNSNATVEVLDQVIRQGAVGTMAIAASNPNATDAMLTDLLETANKILKCLSGGLRKTATDRKADGADELRKAVLRALESRSGTTGRE